VHRLNARIVSDQLLRELAKCEDKLDVWLRSSPANAELFAKDPVRAMRAARLGLHDDVFNDLALVIGSLAQKLAATA
jgi:hypothetical protein